jgi:hypothetical protein
MDFLNAVNFICVHSCILEQLSTNKLGMLGEWFKVTAFLVIFGSAQWEYYE